MHKTITIDGMSCEGCSGRIAKLLNAIDGVNASVSHVSKKAELDLNKEIDDAIFVSTIENAGFKVVGIA